mgnify:CR=1 FL=1
MLSVERANAVSSVVWKPLETDAVAVLLPRVGAYRDELRVMVVVSDA